MRKTTKLTAALFIVLGSAAPVFGQCANETNVTSFTYNGATYEVVQENQTWANAAACAVERGGYLIEINDANEQAMIDGNLPAINVSNTIAPDGGGASYLWIGGNDAGTEGNWTWDGNNDSNGDQFWSGDVNGNPVGGLYNNWGNEPDDYLGQDGLGYAITDWPLGLQEQWNDVDIDNTLYYIIEYAPSSAGIEESSIQPSLIYPNPVNELLEFNLNNIVSFTITNSKGELIQSIDNCIDGNLKIDASTYNAGVYFVNFKQSNGQLIRERFVKL